MDLIKIMDVGQCTACRACEIACSFHHTGTFSPSNSSITVERDFDKGSIVIKVNSTCDCYQNGLESICVEVCSRDVFKKN